MLRSILFNLAFYGWTTLVSVTAAPALLLPPAATLRVQALWARGALSLMRRLARIDVEIRGRVPRGAVIIAAKHQSAWDTLIWHVVVRNPAIVMKKELQSIPFYGWYTRKSRMIPIDREGGGRELKSMLRAAAVAVREGRPVIIFPEGTRTAPDVRVPYQPGVAALYRYLGVEVVPVAVNSGVFWPRRRFIRRPGTIVLEFLEPIPPGMERRAFTAELEMRIESASAALVAEARGGMIARKPET